MKRLLITAISIFSLLIPAAAQHSDEPKMSVRSFTLAANDNTANLHGTTVLDQNGDPCALIRVQTTQTGFAWDFGQMAACKTEYKTGEIWLYVPYGVKRVTVRHAQLGTMTYEFPIPVAKARTYVMDLVAANVVVLVEQEITQQYVVFHVSPQDAVVDLDGQLLETRNGLAKKKVKFGKHEFNVTAKDYHSFSGVVEVNTADSSAVVDISLVPAFGTLNFAADAALNGAVVFLDDEQMGTLPFSSALQVPSGRYTLRLMKPKYKAYSQTVIISDGQHVSLSPVLSPNYSTVSISSAEGAEIWANDVKLGTSPWSGELQYDTYSFEVRKPSHRTVYKTVDFFEGAPATITLPSPVPMYGSLDLDCEVIASVSLDGQPVGKTPCIIPKILTGEHVLTLSAPGYQTATRTVTIRENKTESDYITLVKGRLKVNVTLNTDSDADIRVNGVYKGKGTWSGILEEGDYEFTSYKLGCNDGKLGVSIVGADDRRFTIPSPAQKTGTVSLTTNAGGASFNIYTSEDGTPVAKGVLPTAVNLPIGDYKVDASKSKYYSSSSYPFTVYDGRTTSVDINMKRRYWISTWEDFAPVFGELTYGYDIGNHKSYWGLNFGYVSRHLGLNSSFSTNFDGKYNLTLGPALRLTSDYNDIDFQLYAGGGIEFGRKFDWMAEAGCRMAFDNVYSDGMQWLSMTFGAKFNSNCVIPTVGVSLMPVALVGLLSEEYESYPSNFLYSLYSVYPDESFGIGLGYQHLETHIGVYVDFMSSVEEWNPSLTAGTAVRLTSDSLCDLQIYGGLGYCEGFAQEFGMRLGWDSNTGLSLWDFSVGAMHTPEGWMPKFSLGTGITLGAICIVGSIYLGVLAGEGY